MPQTQPQQAQSPRSKPQSREDKFRARRIIQLDKLIRGGTYPSVEKLTAKYGVSRRTILRDIEFLRDRYEAPAVNAG